MIALATLLLAAAAAATPAPDAEWQVHVAVQVAGDGHATGCRIVESNAPAEMQAKTCQILVDKAKFTPKRDADGSAIASVYETTIRYRVPGAAAQ